MREHPRENRKNPKIGRCGTVLVALRKHEGGERMPPPLLRSVTQDSRGDANEPFRRGLKIVKAILAAARDISSPEGVL